MNWQCNYCEHRIQPFKEVEENGIDWPAGRACCKCGKGEMVYRTTEVYKMNITIEQLKKLIMKYDHDNTCYPESEYEGLSVYSFICKESGIQCDLEEYDRPDQKYAKFLKDNFKDNQYD